MIKITDENRSDLIASCLMEAANIMQENNIKVLEEATIKSNKSELKYDIWIDPAGSNRNKSDVEPRLKVAVNGNRIPIYIPKSKGEKPYILVKNIEAKQKSKTGKIKGLDDVYNFILKYNDILLMCYYLDSPIFDNIFDNDKIIRDIFSILIKNNRDTALLKISKLYNIPADKIIPDKYKNLKDNF